MSNSICFFLNGNEYSTNSNLTICEILTYFSYSNALFVLEYNKLICTKKNWDTMYIRHNDRIELITIVGGG